MQMEQQRPLILKKSPQGNACHKTMTGNRQRQHFNTDVQQMTEADVYCMF